MTNIRPPEDNYFNKDEDDSITIGGVSIDLSEYLTTTEGSNLFVSKSSINDYPTKDELETTLQPIEDKVTSLEDKTSLITKVDDQTLKISGNLQLDSGTIQELTHEKLKIQDSIKILVPRAQEPSQIILLISVPFWQFP